MPRLSRNNLEAIALHLLRSYWQLPEAKYTPDRVRPELLLSSLLHLSVQYRHLTRDGSILGITAFDQVDVEILGRNGPELFSLDSNTVLIESDLLGEEENVGRRNFTLAHEGSHHILNQMFPAEYSELTRARKVLQYRYISPVYRNPIDWAEWQADTLASALLMPRALVWQNMNDAGFHGPEFAQFKTICDRMGVSAQALALRMQRLGLLKQNQLLNPNSLLDIEMEDN